jgi:hypothetical protein
VPLAATREARVEDYAEIAPAARKWGLPVVRFWGAQRPAPEALTVGAPAPQVTVTVIHIEAGAYLNVGGPMYGSRTLAVPQQRAAITATSITEVEEWRNGTVRQQRQRRRRRPHRQSPVQRRRLQ